MATRRRVVQGLGALALLHAAPSTTAIGVQGAGLPERFRFDAPPFGLGVASGDPRPQSVTIWTRLAADPLDPEGHGGLSEKSIPVQWAVATDSQMRNVVRSGMALARRSNGYSVHVDVDRLVPERHYWYCFAAGSRQSRTGRTRTTPAGAVATIRFACVCCQDLVALYGAYANLATETLDFVVHLGDTIYESAHDGRAAQTLADFRCKHALFRADPLARDAWAAHPFVVTWDDHEVRENYSGTDGSLDRLRAAAYQAFHEHMPLRLPEGRPDDWRHLRIYRHQSCGDLLELELLDLRQYRSALPKDSSDAGSSGRSLMGAAQKTWLLDRLRRSESKWCCIGSPVFMAQTHDRWDAWDGFPHERWELLGALRHRRGRAVVLSGDGHRAIASRLHVGDAGPQFVPGDRVVAMEFGVPALSSKAAGPERPDPDAGFTGRSRLPWIVYEDRGYRGYLVCEVDRERWRSIYRVLRNGRSSTMTTLAAFEMTPSEDGPGLVSSGFEPFRT